MAETLQSSRKRSQFSTEYHYEGDMEEGLSYSDDQLGEGEQDVFVGYNDSDFVSSNSWDQMVDVT
jgi:hypothetical protein